MTATSWELCPHNSQRVTDVTASPTRPTHTDMGWPISPEGLTEQLVHLKDEYPNLPPVYTTENGGAYDDPVVDGRCADPRRIEYLGARLRALRALRALRDASTRVSASLGTTSGRCWTTSNGHSAMTSGSASCTSTSRRSSARPATAPSGTATSSQPMA